MKDEWPVWSGAGDLGIGYTAAWGALVGLFGLAYLAGVVFLLPRQRKMERAASGRDQSADTVVGTESKRQTQTI